MLIWLTLFVVGLLVLGLSVVGHREFARIESHAAKRNFSGLGDSLLRLHNDYVSEDAEVAEVHPTSEDSVEGFDIAGYTDGNIKPQLLASIIKPSNIQDNYWRFINSSILESGYSTTCQNVFIHPTSDISSKRVVPSMTVVTTGDKDGYIASAQDKPIRRKLTRSRKFKSSIPARSSSENSS